MYNLIDKIKENTKIFIKKNEYTILTKTWYSILEDPQVEYIKCELTKNQVLVIIPSDNYIYIGSVIDNLDYVRLNDHQLKYRNTIFNKSGEGHQYIKNIEFGNPENVEGKCIFEDYESEENIISLGVLTEGNVHADVYAEILKMDDIEIVDNLKF